VTIGGNVTYTIQHSDFKDDCIFTVSLPGEAYGAYLGVYDPDSPSCLQLPHA
jgi:hypothetical protein